MKALQFLVNWTVGWIHQKQQAIIDYLLEENRILREQIDSRLQLTDADRMLLARKAHVLKRRTLQNVACIAKADTLQRWYRKLVVQGETSQTKNNKLGRPPVTQEKVQLVLQFAEENPSWGYLSIRNTLSGLGISVSQSSIKRILRNHGIEPAPQRSKRGLSWELFFKLHWKHLDVAKLFDRQTLSIRNEGLSIVNSASPFEESSVAIAGNVPANPQESSFEDAGFCPQPCMPLKPSDNVICLKREPLRSIANDEVGPAHERLQNKCKSSSYPGKLAA